MCKNLNPSQPPLLPARSTPPDTRPAGGLGAVRGGAICSPHDKGELEGVCTTDKFWRGDILGCDANLAPWLRDHGSLTQRIQQRCNHFAVRKVHSGLARIALDESALLGIAPQRLAYSRDVFLYADNQPVVFAHSVCATRSLHGAWSAVAGLGSQPLGALLFAHPLVKRQPLHYKALRATHPLYQQAATVLANPPSKLWARRSLFYLRGEPLLVTEVFLPRIMQLKK